MRNGAVALDLRDTEPAPPPDESLVVSPVENALLEALAKLGARADHLQEWLEQTSDSVKEMAARLGEVRDGQVEFRRAIDSLTHISELNNALLERLVGSTK